MIDSWMNMRTDTIYEKLRDIERYAKSINIDKVDPVRLDAICSAWCDVEEALVKSGILRRDKNESN